MNYGLDGRVVVITGAGSGIGLATCRVVLEEGGSVAIEHFAREVRKLPLGKLGDPDDVARVIAFLASDVSKHVTGADYTVDGGVVAAA